MDLKVLRDGDLDQLRAIELVATDMDGTLTVAEKFTPDLLLALERLTKVGIPVVIVTGRSAGWVSAIRHYLPVAGAICENGGFLYRGDEPELLVMIDGDITEHRQRLATTFAQLQQRFPQIRESQDNRFRLTDWTFDVAGLSQAALEQMEIDCAAMGWGFTYSTVQCHIALPQQKKAHGLKRAIDLMFPALKSHQVITVGDSPNDVSMFDRDKFSISVGVANVVNYLNQMQHHPLFVTERAEGLGFCELVDRLVMARS
jgi:HAD superfamily hydrolase (TIGR01484 family)